MLDILACLNATMRTIRISRRRFPHYININWFPWPRNISINNSNNFRRVCNTCPYNKQVFMPKYSWSTRGRNHLNYLTCNHTTFSCTSLPSPTILNRWGRGPPSDNKNNWTPVILKVWVFRFWTRSAIWFLHSANRRPCSRPISASRSRQSCRPPH